MKKNFFLFICKDPYSLINFRGEFIKELQNRGFIVSAICNDLPTEKIRAKLRIYNIECHTIKYQHRNPLVLLRSIFLISKLIHKINPSHILSYTLAATIIGSAASFLARQNNYSSLVTGRGILFTGKNLKQRVRKTIVIFVLRILYPLNKFVLFQNKDDAKLFEDLKIISSEKSYVVSGGSGVNTDYFLPTPFPSSLVFLTIGRLLKHKGLYEFAEASKKLKKIYPKTKFLIAGIEDSSPDRIELREIKDDWPIRYGTEYIGRYEDIREAISMCSVYVLLSHHEGVPRSSLEAMSMGRPVLTTDAPGCNETVIDNQNGFLVEPRNYHAAFEAMKKFAENNHIRKMGIKSREICKAQFDVKKVNDRMLDILQIT